MRVIAGKARSLHLKTPTGEHTRPTTDRIKETLFNMLQPYLPDCIFLDLFSGSGGIGIEALSRGARHAYFVENQKDAIACIQQNLQFTRLNEDATILKQDVLSALSCIHEKEADIIFMDPPYEQGFEKQALALLGGLPYVTPDTVIIVEALRQSDFSYVEPLGFSVTKEKVYKTNKHVFLKKQEKFENF
ncbi:MAG: 16S rRNA (guanine(966)-N(2))-methyltransferase RsmD [Blautia sp.]|nr:16S rRNA (guanine(966)-N(2))-methyltransferase RsmD [Lachnoclostridium sp.]MCM1210841.1 16S rRNA (guanine(966)-N(2))-methyltransferase RsmD [Blautia sp.]